MSAIVLAALVLMWAVVLVPMFLRRQERSQELAAAQRFAGAMRVLSRRRRTPHGSALVGGPVAGSASGERRAEVISQALAKAPSRPDRSLRPAPSAPVAAGRRAARVEARRRGLAVMVSAIFATAILAVLVGGWLIALQGLTDVLALAGLAQLRASALADRATLGLPVSDPRPEARITTAPASPRVAPSPLRTSVASVRPSESLAAQDSSSVPAARRPGKQIVFDAVSETPIVARVRVPEQPSRVAPKPVKRMVPGVPEDFYERPVSPPRPERVQRPLLDPVDTDPATLTEDLERLDGILGRASGQ